MQTRTETVATIWVGMTQEQRNDLIQWIAHFNDFDVETLTRGLDANVIESVSALRQALLNA